MLKKLYELGCFDYQKFILENCKRLSLSCNEAVVLINILKQYLLTHKLSIEELESNLSMTRTAIQNTLSNLMERDFYQIFIQFNDGLGEESISLDGFFKKSEAIIMNNQIMPEDEIHVVTKYLAERLNRILTSQEIDIITSLVIDDRYNLECFKKACNSLDEKKRLLTIRAIAQELAKKDAPKQEVKATPGFVKDFMNKIK